MLKIFLALSSKKVQLLGSAATIGGSIAFLFEVKIL